MDKNLSKHKKHRACVGEDFATKNKICIFVTLNNNLQQEDFALTNYGRERAKICAGGFDGCDGPAINKNIFNESLCESCFKIINQIPVKHEH